MTLNDSLLILPAADEASVPRLDSHIDTLVVARCRAALQSKRSDAVETVTVAQPPAWEQGLEPAARTTGPDNNSGFLLVIAVLFVVMIFNFRHLKRLAGTYIEELIKVRSGRDNVFDERPAGDTRVLVMLILQAVISEGILLAGNLCGIGSLTVAGVAAVSGVIAIYYIAMLLGYNVVGYTFAPAGVHRDWVRGFNASQALLGILLVVPAVLSIFYPYAATAVITVSAVIYVLVRLLFIFKGFRIFYTNIGSLVYFILYLCTLEIIPIIYVYKCASILSQSD